MSADKKTFPLTLKQENLQFDSEYEQLYKQKQQYIQQKIDKSIQKHKHILKIQQQLQQKLRRKNEQILRKLNKSIEAKNKKMIKIRQKCQLRLKYQSEKINAHKKKQKIQLHRSWRQSLKLSQWIMNKNSSNRKIASQVRQQKSETQQEARDEVYDFPGNKTNNNGFPNLDNKKQAISTNNQAKTKQIFVQPGKRYERVKSQHSRPTKQLSNSINYIQKVRQREQMQQKQQIKRINLKLQKLQQARMKKQKLQKQRQKKIHDLLNYKNQKWKQNKLNRKIQSTKRMKSIQKRAKTIGDNDDQQQQANEQHQLNKSKMFKRWQQNSKIRQIQLFQNRLRKGQDYMQLMKNKTTKNKINRSVQQNSIEKKLYMQRKRMYELMQNSLKN